MNILPFICESVFETRFDLVMFSIIAIVSTVLMIFVGYRLLQMLQLTGYKLKSYFKWFKETKCSYVSRLFMLTFLSFLSMALTNVLLEDFFTGRLHIFSYCSMIFYLLFCSMFIINMFNAKQKTPLKYTKRMKRLVIVYTAIVACASLVIEYIGYKYFPFISHGLISLVPLFLPLFVILAHFITWPVEKIIANSYIKRAKEKLKSIKNVKVIGITGSYGKTSVKNILSTILSQKYKVCPSPASYNTPLGLAKTILSNLKDDDEIFIAEMGARQVGDIDELCQMVEPDIGIITGVGNQHYLTFGSVDNIIKTKSELVSFVSKNKGKVFINVDGELARKIYENYSKATAVSLNNNIFELTDMKTTKDGSSFVLRKNGEEKKCKTVLLGEHNISNIILACTVADSLGLSLDEIAEGISKLRSVPHRLDIIKTTSTYTIIDNSFNSSVEGTKASIDVLSKFEGRKFVITPGIVELGKEQFNANFEFGKIMAGVCDYVIIDSMINFEAINAGLIHAGFKKDNILRAGSLSQAVMVLNTLAEANDVVLFENDLPDNYS